MKKFENIFVKENIKMFYKRDYFSFLFKYNVVNFVYFVL